MGRIWHLSQTVLVKMTVTYVKGLVRSMPHMLAVVFVIICETSRTLVSLLEGDRDQTLLCAEQLACPS